jgi:small subunit ribosomal protein S23
MGRHGFKALRVHQTASSIIETASTTPRSIASKGQDEAVRPVWYDVVEQFPPSQPLIRTQPIRHRSNIKSSKPRKPSKMFQPQRISYQEDRLRQVFFRDHPWELARPRILLEKDGKDLQNYDWSHIKQHGRQLDGER